MTLRAPARQPLEGAALRAGLVRDGLLVETGVPGLVARTAAYEAVVSGIDHLVTEAFAHLAPGYLHFPPVLARTAFRRTGYLESFPDLMGSVHVFVGGDEEHRELLRRSGGDERWEEVLEPSQVVLVPAACHALYPLLAGRLPAGGAAYEVRADCFRHEPSDDPARLQSFRMHEVVVLGSPAQAEAHRAAGVELAVGLLEPLGLDVAVVPANDPFFGRAGKVLARGQRDEGLKVEVVTTITSGRSTAVASGNCHRDHFGSTFAIEQHDGSTAHSACVGFGVDRVSLALVSVHGTDLSDWPAGVRALLGL